MLLKILLSFDPNTTVAFSPGLLLPFQTQQVALVQFNI